MARGEHMKLPEHRERQREAMRKLNAEGRAGRQPAPDETKNADKIEREALRVLSDRKASARDKIAASNLLVKIGRAPSRPEPETVNFYLILEEPSAEEARAEYRHAILRAENILRLAGTLLLLDEEKWRPIIEQALDVDELTDAQLAELHEYAVPTLPQSEDGITLGRCLGYRIVRAESEDEALLISSGRD